MANQVSSDFMSARGVCWIPAPGGGHALAMMSPTEGADAELQANKFVTINAVGVATETTLWTPASGKRFRLMGGLLSIVGAVGNVLLKDGSGGSVIFILPNIALSTPLQFSIGNGILSGAINNALTATGVALMVLNGTIWGREE